MMDLYNEPLNLSVRSKPVAVVPPSSSNKNYDCETVRMGTPSNFHSELSQDESTSDTQNTTENIKTVMHQQYNSSNNNNNILSNVDNASVRNVSEPNLLNLASHANGNSTSATMLSIKKKNLVDNNNSDDDEEDEDNDSMSRNASPASVPYQKSAISAILTAYMENFHEHQQSLDAAKLHLQQYLKLTNQYLQKYAELVPSDMSIAASSAQSHHHQNTVGSNNNNNSSSSNDTINNIIHTNILTNKITTNNLISIINKLLEQNIVSEFYFKHATAFQEQQKLRQDICHDELDYDGGPSPGGMSATTIALMGGNGTSNMMAGGMLGGMILDQLSLSSSGNNNNNNGASSNNTRHDRHSVMLSDNNNSSSSSLMTTNAVLSGIGGLTAPLFMNQSHANKLKTMKNLAMIARERCIKFIDLSISQNPDDPLF